MAAAKGFSAGRGVGVGAGMKWFGIENVVDDQLNGALLHVLEWID